MFFCMRTSSRRTTVSDIAEQLRLLVSTGELVGGEPLRQEELAARFGISRAQLREAIARRGAVVFKPLVPELLEICEIRLLLEPRLAWSAAAQREQRGTLRPGAPADDRLLPDGSDGSGSGRAKREVSV